MVSKPCVPDALVHHGLNRVLRSLGENPLDVACNFAAFNPVSGLELRDVIASLLHAFNAKTFSLREVRTILAILGQSTGPFARNVEEMIHTAGVVEFVRGQSAVRCLNRLEQAKNAEIDPCYVNCGQIVVPSRWIVFRMAKDAPKAVVNIGCPHCLTIRSFPRWPVSGAMSTMRIPQLV
jgi:hypothetical protein